MYHVILVAEEWRYWWPDFCGSISDAQHSYPDVKVSVPGRPRAVFTTQKEPALIMQDSDREDRDVSESNEESEQELLEDNRADRNSGDKGMFGSSSSTIKIVWLTEYSDPAPWTFLMRRFSFGLSITLWKVRNKVYPCSSTFDVVLSRFLVYTVRGFMCFCHLISCLTVTTQME